MLDDALAAAIGDLLVPSFSRSPSRHARRLARRYASGQLIECDAYLAAGLDAAAERGRLRLNAADACAQWRSRPGGRRLPWQELTLLQGLGPAWLNDGARLRVSAHGWRVRAADGADAVLLIDAPYGARFARLVLPSGSKRTRPSPDDVS